MSSLATSNPVPAVKGEDCTNPRVFFITLYGIENAGENEESDKSIEDEGITGVTLAPWAMDCCCGPVVGLEPVFRDNFEITNDVLVRSGLSEADIRGLLTDLSFSLKRRSTACWGAGYTGPLCPIICMFFNMLFGCNRPADYCCMRPAMNEVRQIVERHNQTLRQKGNSTDPLGILCRKWRVCSRSCGGIMRRASVHFPDEAVHNQG